MPNRRPVVNLYSGSPRRRELLESVGLPFAVRPADADETADQRLSPPEVVTDIARRKLAAGLAEHDPEKRSWGLAADTLVEGPAGLLGKPADESHAREMIRSLSGVPHRVHSGFVVHRPAGSWGPNRIESGCHSTMVRFRPLSEDDVEAYLAAGEWRDVAGAYRIQGRGAMLVEAIEGLWSTVVGLPLAPLFGILTEMSYPRG